MRAPVNGDRAVPALSLSCVIEDRDGARRLRNPPETTRASADKIRNVGRQAAHPQAVVLDVVRAIDAVDRVVSERVKSLLGRHRGVRPALAAAPFVLARLRGLDEG